MATPEQGKKWGLSGLLVALGLIFGDIGTSPLYVFQAIIGSEKVNADLILGSLSCIFWTLIIITTFKYVYLALKADNRGEGGIFALYARVRRYRARWVIFPALIGCATLMGDGVITPAISISAAVEGLHRFYPKLNTVPFVLAILFAIFLAQSFRISKWSRASGPVMFLWFCLIGYLGLEQIMATPSVMKAINPMYAVDFILNFRGELSGIAGFWLLGGVFLCTTGAEALYSDLGRSGKTNIRLTWLFVFPCLVLSYFGQGAWLMQFDGQVLPATAQKVGVLYAMMPEGWVLPATILAIIATILVSQALLAGIFTMVHEAISLRLWFKMRVVHPTDTRGEVYIPFINWFLFGGCVTTVLVFQDSSHMEAAYGLAIVIDMIMTSSLLLHFIHMRNQSLRRAIAIGCIFGFVELAFLISNIHKIPYGGWFSLLSAAVIFSCVFIFYKGRQLRVKHTEFVPIQDYLPVIKDLIKDETVQREATNLVYMTFSSSPEFIDTNIVYSMFRKKPKRADIYWFVHIEHSDIPFAQSYKVHAIVPGTVFYVSIKLGFKIEQRVNRIFKEIVLKMQADGEVDEKSHYPSLRKYDIPADFKFIILNTRASVDDDFSPFDQFIIRAYRQLKRVSITRAEDFGLDKALVVNEVVPIYVGKAKDMDLVRQK